MKLDTMVFVTITTSLVLSCATSPQTKVETDAKQTNEQNRWPAATNINAQLSENPLDIAEKKRTQQYQKKYQEALKKGSSQLMVEC